MAVNERAGCIMTDDVLFQVVSSALGAGMAIGFVNLYRKFKALI